MQETDLTILIGAAAKYGIKVVTHDDRLLLTREGIEVEWILAEIQSVIAHHKSEDTMDEILVRASDVLRWKTRGIRFLHVQSRDYNTYVMLDAGPDDVYLHGEIWHYFDVESSGLDASDLISELAVL